jgi:hypothetical protein
MHIHVFTIDILPAPGVVTTGGSLRSQQIIEGLRGRGHEVSYSVPNSTPLARRQWELLSDEERANAFGPEIGGTYLDIITRLRPDAVVALWPMAFSFPRRGREGPIIVYDANGLQNVEGFSASVASGAGQGSLTSFTRSYLNKLMTADLLLCGSPEQKAYWQGLLSFHLDTVLPPEMIELPYYPAVTPTPMPYDAGPPRLFCAGSFLPWNSPEGHLLQAARLLAEAGRGELVVIGRPDITMDHARSVDDELAAIDETGVARLTEGMPYDEFSSAINGGGVAIDLNAPTLERRLAVPIRTVTYLAHGVPLLTNAYSSLGKEIAARGAGWAIDPTDPAAFRAALTTILDASADQLATMSRAARQLARERFDAPAGFSDLGAALDGRAPRRRVVRAEPRRVSPAIAEDLRPCVLIVSDDFENFLELRVRIPFDAMFKIGLIKGYHVFSRGRIVRSVGVKAEIQNIDVVWVQRVPSRNPLFLADTFDGRFVYDIDDNLLVTASYRPPFSPEFTTIVRTLLRGAKAVTTTSTRLMASLQRNSEIQIEHKTVLAPNLAEQIDVLPGEAKPDALLLAASDHLPLTASRTAFLSAIEQFARSHEMPLVYVGTEANDFSRTGIPVRSTGTLDYFTYREFIRRHNVMAIVPLERHGDPRTQDFIDSKSDIKMVEFGSCGVPAVYADVAPYRDTILRCGPLVDMGDAEAIRRALDEVYGDADRVRERARKSVGENRLAADVVHFTWFAAVEQARLPVPLPLSVLLEREDRYASFTAEPPAPEALFSADKYLERNPDLLDRVAAARPAGALPDAPAYKHYAAEGATSGRVWFPNSIANAQHLMLRVREDAERQFEALTQLESKVAEVLGGEAKPANGLPTASAGGSQPTLRRLYRRVGKALGLKVGPRMPPLFDPEYYLRAYPDVKAAGADPYSHYLSHGVAERRNPNAFFDTAWYVSRNPEAARSGVDPLRHYVETGAAAGADPSPRFSTKGYSRHNPDAGQMNPLEHFLKKGRLEGRDPRPR